MVPRSYSMLCSYMYGTRYRAPRCIHLLSYGTLGTIQKYFGVILLSMNQLNKCHFSLPTSSCISYIISPVSSISFLLLAAPVVCIM
ncbi:hypothetical protein F4813DRAFT_245097 [Daldinia decipiens]|uniref:uncharacterized protein n=1 Tax=Daldinia decipiens TaxID=326647 RepID=UPI0020C439CD|nr:uncharacterized protein F4813DRAFT_245097 [Daldinia decipiens]KAI1653768.1 hypothetical protein F4813DRAFT_245097 [Daldinia decipiens]